MKSLKSNNSLLKLPFKILNYLIEKRYVSYLIVGSTGALIQIVATWLITELILGRENYFYGYLIGLFLNLLYNFILYTLNTFKPKKNHGSRLITYILYAIVSVVIQIYIVKFVTPIIGINYYIYFITFLIFIISVINFFVYKYWLFKDKR